MKQKNLDEAVADLRRTFLDIIAPRVIPILDWLEPRVPILSIWPFFRWYDLWIGLYIDRTNRTLYICPVPMFGIAIRWRFEGD